MELLRFLAQVSAVLLAVGGCGRIARLLRQPAVVGEIAGGLLLGPSALGRWLPSVEAWLFPPQHLYGLGLLSNAGVVLFLFVLGAEFHRTGLHSRRALLITSAGSVALPCLAGMALAVPLLRYAPENVSFWPFALFVGTAVSVTALPVLGRILQDRADEGKPVRPEVAGLALPVAAANDLAAWLLLLTAVGMARTHTAHQLLAMQMPLLLAFACVLVFGVRPALQRLVDTGRMPLWALSATCVLLALGSAWCTDALGIHAFSGAVLAGVCAPRLRPGQCPLAEEVRQRLRPLLAIGLPVFFALTGLRTKLTFAGVWNRWMLAILVIAVLSKVVAGTAGARFAGLPWRWAAETGVLLNTRGLVELVVLNVGLREGVLSPALFAMLVVMALGTTAMTVPLLDALRRGEINDVTDAEAATMSITL